MDVDGTLTDGKIYMGAEGELFKAFNVKDGMGIKLLQEKGVIVVIITSRKSDIVINRANELGITEIHQGVKDKVKIVNALVEKYKISLKHIFYIGDDVNDLPVIAHVGYSFCPADSADDVRAKVDFVLTKKGGEGAVREAIDLILKGI